MAGLVSNDAATNEANNVDSGAFTYQSNGQPIVPATATPFSYNPIVPGTPTATNPASFLTNPAAPSQGATSTSPGLLAPTTPGSNGFGGASSVGLGSPGMGGTSAPTASSGGAGVQGSSATGSGSISSGIGNNNDAGPATSAGSTGGISLGGIIGGILGFGLSAIPGVGMGLGIANGLVGAVTGQSITGRIGQGVANMLGFGPDTSGATQSSANNQAIANSLTSSDPSADITGISVDGMGSIGNVGDSGDSGDAGDASGQASSSGAGVADAASSSSGLGSAFGGLGGAASAGAAAAGAAAAGAADGGGFGGGYGGAAGGGGGGDAYSKGGYVMKGPGKPSNPNLYAEGGLMTDPNNTQSQSMQPGEGTPPNQYLTSPDDAKFLKPSPVIQKIIYTRLESLNQDDVTTFKNMITPASVYVLSKIVPELAPVLQRFAEMNATEDNPDQGPDDGSQSAQPDASSQGQGQDQSQQSGTPGFASGGAVSLASMFGIGHSNTEDQLNRNGYVNKGIPSSSLAKGGVPMAAPRPMALERPTSPASTKFSSRVYNNPKYADGGAGGLMQPQGQPQTSPTGNPDTDQAIQNQKIAEQVVPAGGTADNVDAKVSKGEFVMDAATTMFYGMNKLITMQEKAHEEIAKHIGKQDAQQQDAQGGGDQQQAQPQQQQAAAPAPQQQAQMPSSPPPSSVPNATEQRIQQTNTSRPSNPFSLMG